MRFHYKRQAKNSNINSILKTSDGSHTIKSSIYNETFHSTHGAKTESLHVFIKEGLEHFINHHKPKHIDIFEMGMGTGLNVLLTLNNQSSISIDYTTLELHPIPAEEYKKLNYEGQDIHSLSSLQLIHTFPWESKQNLASNFNLTKNQINILDYKFNQTFDLIYYDAFGPKTQPELWDLGIVSKLYNALNPNGILVTYCAMGQFKRNLKNVGFTVESIPGPPGKREMTRAVKQ